jgi:glycosidase
MRTLPFETIQRVRNRLASLYGDKVAPRLTDRLELLAGRYGVRTADECTFECHGWSAADMLLITYGDMVLQPGERPLVTLRRFLDERLQGAIPIVHILPFFPYSSDDGFSVIDYRQVDPALGNWDDVRALGEGHRLMFDLVLNHVSSRSKWFQAYLKGITPERDYFIDLPPDTDLSEVVRPRSTPVLSMVHTNRGDRWVWTTFSADQVDLDFSNQDVLFEFLDILLFYVANGARVIRLDAIAYLWKRVGSSCINLPETHEVVKLMRDVLNMFCPGLLLLTETNLPHDQNVSYFGDGDEAQMVYQFSLPPLLLHALHTGTTRHLRDWAAGLEPPPPGCTFLNFTASHDGIGVRPLEGIVPEAEVDALVKAVLQRGGQVSMRANPDGSQSPYELNITYFDALSDPGAPDRERQIARFLCSQTIMLSLQGMPAVYFQSLVGAHNDPEGVERSGRARSINRHKWQLDELGAALDDPAGDQHRVFHAYLRLLKLRAAQPAFHPDGPQRILDLEDGLFGLERRAPEEAPEGEQRIVCISNLSAEPRSLRARDAVPEPFPDQLLDLLSEAPTPVDAGATIQLAPYRTVWLTSSRARQASRA